MPKLYLSRCMSLHTFRVCIHGLSGEYIDEWEYKLDTSRPSVKQLTVLKDQVVIPDQSQWRPTVYSIDGNFIKHIPYSLSDSTLTETRALGTDNVIAYDRGTSKLSNVKVSTSEIIWTSTTVYYPSALASIGVQYVCIAGSRKIYIHNAGTGI